MVMVAVCAAVQTLAPLAMAQPAAAQSLEYAVKASYLVRFAAFVEWPARAFPAPHTPVSICVVGRDPFGAAIDRAAASQTAHGRRLLVRRPTGAADLHGCHIAYVATGTPTATTDALSAMPTTLIVTDGAVSTRRGVVDFVVADNRVRFHIDQQAASRRGLSISSRLLSLALSVRGVG